MNFPATTNKNYFIKSSEGSVIPVLWVFKHYSNLGKGYIHKYQTHCAFQENGKVFCE